MNEKAREELKQLWEDKGISKGDSYGWTGLSCPNCEQSFSYSCNHIKYSNLNEYLAGFYPEQEFIIHRVNAGGNKYDIDSYPSGDFIDSGDLNCNYKDREDIKNLKEENAFLKEENEFLKADNVFLKEENTFLKADKELLESFIKGRKCELILKSFIKDLQKETASLIKK